MIDDEPSICLTLETGLRLKGFSVDSAASAQEALELYAEKNYDAVLCDVLMPEVDGLTLTREIRLIDADVPLILMTAQGSVETAVQAVSFGATDFIAKPFEISAVAELIERRISARQEPHEKEDNNFQKLSGEFSRTGLIGRSAPMVQVYKLIAYAARTDATVLITGESGTGKELVATAIHRFSDRASGPFISVNCSGLTETLLEAELFGYEKGAFTGATTSKTGLFEAANGGTIFLDELASTSGGFQASLLRVIQSGEIRRVGSTEKRKVEVRVIAASNADLPTLVEAGKFRADLYYRLSVLTIDLPPLRERLEDVPLLTRYFLRNISRGGKVPHVSHEVWDAICSYGYPGNVRELENSLVRAVALSGGDVITLDHLPASIVAAAYESGHGPANSPGDLIFDRPTLDELQRRYLSLVLAENHGNRRLTAETLGVDRRTVQRLIAKYGLAAQDDDDHEFDPLEEPAPSEH